METPLDQFTTPPTPDKGTFGKILLWNFGLMFGVVVLTSISGNVDTVIYDLIFMVLQVIINLLLGLYFLVAQKRTSGFAHLLSAILVVLVGFGMCAGKIAIMES